MSIVINIIVFFAILIDFIYLDKQNKKAVYIYLSIVFLIIVVLVVDNYNLFKLSPLEVFINKMGPITNWVNGYLNK